MPVQSARQREHYCLDPVRAYDTIAAFYPEISQRRRLYLDSVDDLVANNISSASRSLLDIGAGDGRRALKIARLAGISDLVLLEPSREMQRYWPESTRGWSMRAEELGEQTKRFDVITCLWNVLGHVPTLEYRGLVLNRLRSLLTPDGVMFIDVNHRYNARAYGIGNTVARYFRDRVRPGAKNGDVVVRWVWPDLETATSGHVFTDREMRTLLRDANLRIEKRFVVDYASGELRRWTWSGNLLYMLRPDR